MNENQKIHNIKELIKDYSIETTPNVYEKYGGLKDLLNINNNIYITYLPDEDPNRVIDTAKKINEEGFRAVPHLPARTINDFQDLERYIGSLSEVAGCNKILVIGGGAKKAGKIESSLRVLHSDFLSKYNFERVGVAGHPDGNPDISKVELDKAIIEKNKFAKL